jgi:hypothetical protein
MRATKPVAFLAGLLMALGAPAIVADETPETVEGEVVRVMQQTGNEGELDALMIRTRQGEEMRLLLGRAGTSEGRVQEGDRIRARLASGDPAEEGYRVRSMNVRRTGERLRYRDGSGEMLQAQDRSRDRDGTGGGGRARSRDRARIHEPGTGNCPHGRAGAGHRGSRGGGRR